MGTWTLLQVSSLIRKSAGYRIFAPNRSLSQLVTSFFGSQCQGIRLMLLFAWPKQCLILAFKIRSSFFTIVLNFCENAFFWFLGLKSYLPCLLFFTEKLCLVFLAVFFNTTSISLLICFYTFFLFSFQGTFGARRFSFKLHVVENKGIEPLTPCVQGRCSPSWANSP